MTRNLTPRQVRRIFGGRTRLHDVKRGLLLVAIIVGAALLTTQWPVAAAIATVLVGGLFAITLTSLRFPFILVPVLVGLAVRLAALFVHENVFRLPQALDAGGFVLRALRLFELPSAQHWVEFGTGAASVPWLTAWLFKLVGPHPIVGQVVMLVLGVALIVATCRLAEVLGASKQMIVVVAWAMAFFPQPIVHSVQLLREIPFSLFLTMALTQLVLWNRSRQPMYALRGVLFVLGAAVFHAAAIFVFAAFVVFAAVRAVSARSATRLILGTVSIAIVLAIGWTVLESEFGAEQFGGSYASIDETFFFRESQGTLGGAAYPEALRIRSLGETWKAPLRLGLFLYAPLPWMISTARQALGVIDSLLFIIATFMIVRGWRYWRSIGRMTSVQLVAVLTFVGMTVFAMGVSNYGTAIRHRAKFAPPVVVLAVAAIDRRSASVAMAGVGAREARRAVSPSQAVATSPWVMTRAPVIGPRGTSDTP